MGNWIKNYLIIEKNFTKKRKKIKEYEGIITIPNIVRRNLSYSLENLSNINLQIQGEVRIEDTFINELGKSQALFVLDCIGSYVNCYRDNGSSNTMQLISVDNNPFYLINDSFSNFCKRGFITGRDKRMIKEYLFGDKKKPYGPLNSVSMVIPTGDGNHRLVDMDFISVSYVARNPTNKSLLRTKDKTGKFVVQPAKNNKQDTLYQIDNFTIQLNFNLYNYVEYLRANIKEKDINQINQLKHLGYFTYPVALTAKIKGLLKQTKRLETVVDIQAGRALERNFDKFVRGFHYIATKWQTGSEKRESFMVVDYRELQKNVGFPKYSKGRGLNKQEDLDVMARLIAQFIQDKAAFDDCADVRCIRTMTEIPLQRFEEIRAKNRNITFPFIILELEKHIQERKIIEKVVKKELTKSK